MSYLSGLLYKLNMDLGQFVMLIFGLFGILFGLMIVTFIFSQNSAENVGLNETMSAEHVAISNQIQNDSLNAIRRYTSLTDTQFLVLAISIVIFICIILYKLFESFFANKNIKTSKTIGSDVGF